MNRKEMLANRLERCINQGIRDIEAMRAGVAALRASAAPEEGMRYVPDIVKNAMLTMWNYICDDTKCHPLDIEHGKGKYLTFTPRHWAQMAGDMAAKNIAGLFALSPDSRKVEPVSTEKLPPGSTITVIIPEGYDTAWDFLHDCGLEAVWPDAALAPATEDEK